MGIDRVEGYYNNEYSSELSKHVYVGGDAYNYIINSNILTEVQVTLKEFFNLIEEVTNYLDTPQSDIEDIIKQLNFPLSEFPTIFTTEEENYIKEAMQQFKT